ncbi:unnamed protein product [Schistocephalus solidus]|uniref:C2H2-type domain-containing protein n=1 Tax=Schistocephalus solidus TaxID=70667 RepID=A0A183SDR4_SCHSO|nr:unnamed protein product [Schistocephalus solidus]
MPQPFQNSRAVNAPSTRDTAWLDIFGRNATTIQQLQLLHPILQPSFRLTHPHPGINSITPTIIETTSLYSSPVTPTTATTTAAVADTATTTTSDGDSLLNCPQCDCTFTSRIGLASNLQVHRTEAGETVTGALTYSRFTHLHCPHCSHTFTHHMGLLGHMRLHNNLW